MYWYDSFFADYPSAIKTTYNHNGTTTMAQPQWGYKQTCTACRVMVLGPPLSGKTSHCQALSGSLGLPLIQVGPLLQAKAAAGDALLQEILQSEGLIPDSKYLEAISERLQQQDCMLAGCLLDGFPHTFTQVQLPSYQ